MSMAVAISRTIGAISAHDVEAPYKSARFTSASDCC